MLPAACLVEGRLICVGDSGPVLSIRHPLAASNPPTRPLSIVFPLALLIIIQSISRDGGEEEEDGWCVMQLERFL